MTEDYDPTFEAVAALQAHGHTVEADEEFERWRVDGGDWLTVGGLLSLAIRLGLNAGVGRLQ